MTPGDEHVPEPTNEDRLAALEARLSHLEDERAIRELLSRYGYYADACLDDAYVALFTPDGEIDVSMGAAAEAQLAASGWARTTGPREKWVGTQGLHAFITNPDGHHQPGFYGHSLHLQGHNIAILVDGDSAVANNYSILLQQDGATLRTLGAGINEWHFAKVDGRWLIRSRKRREIGNTETAAILTATEPPAS
jgi:hypothetical protein